MVLLDQAAYADVAASGFLGEHFARLKRKEADSSVAGQYATLGVAGDNSLIELFGVPPGAGGLTGGLVFSFEQPGSSPAARELLDAGQVDYHHDVVRRALDGTGEQAPWYHLISVNLGAQSPFVLFLNEVTPEYFTSLGARPAGDGALRRRDYLDAVLGGPATAPRLMRDIAGVTLNVRPERARRFADALTPFGYSRETRAGEVRLSGPDLVLTLREHESAPERVAEIQIHLAPGPHERRTFWFGRTSCLEIGAEDTARWVFDPSD
jgi:hypothetical protein